MTRNHFLISIASLFTLLPTAWGETRAPEKEFLWYCESEEATAAQKHTVEEIYIALGIEPKDKTCKEMDNFLRSKDRLSFYFEFRPIEDLSPLAGLDGITSIYCDTCNENAVKTIPDLPSLKSLEVPNSGITSLDMFARFPNLNTVDITGFPLAKDTDFKHLNHVKTVIAGHPATTDLSALKQLNDLRTLFLRNINSFPGDTFPEMPNLQNFTASEINANDLSFLKKLPNIIMLNIFHEDLQHITEFHIPNSVGMLFLGHNNISKIPAGQLPEQLTYLDLTESPLENFDFLKDLGNLRSLYLSDTGLNSWQPLQPVLPSIAVLSLEDNPLEPKLIAEGSKETWPNLEILRLTKTYIESLEFFKNIEAPKLREFGPPDIDNKTEKNCPTTGVPKAVAEFCQSH